MSRSGERPCVALMLESDGPGGAEVMLIHLAEGLRDLGYDVCPVGPDDGCGWLAQQFRERGFEPEMFSIRKSLDLGCVAGLLRVLRKRCVGLVHSHEFTMATYGAVTSLLLQVPHVVTMHGGTAYGRRWHRRLGLQLALERSTAAIAVSGAVRKKLVSDLGLPSESISVIHNGTTLHVGDGASVRVELEVDAADLLLLSVGNLYEVKGHDVLIEALVKVQRQVRGVGWRVAVAGRGKRIQQLRQMAADRGLADRVSFLGHRDDIADLLAAADVYVMPSRSEGLPIALIEAMLAGKAIVASGVGGIPELIEQGRHGILVPPGDPVALAQALERVLRDADLRIRLGKSASEKAAKGYTAEVMVRAYHQVYRDALGGTSAKGRSESKST